MSVSVVDQASEASGSRSEAPKVGTRDEADATTAASAAGGGVVAQTAQEVEALEAEQRGKESLQERIAHRFTAATGTMTFVLINLVWFASWISLNLPAMPTRFDPFPFPLLTMLVSLEAIVLSVLVLISENAQARSAERRASIDMQVNVLAEREVTRLVELVSEIHEKLGLSPPHREEREMSRPTHLTEVARAHDEASPPEAEQRG